MFIILAKEASHRALKQDIKRLIPHLATGLKFKAWPPFKYSKAQTMLMAQ